MCEHVLPLNLPKPHWSYSLWGTRIQEPYTHPPHAPLLSSSPLLFSLCGFPHFWQAMRWSSAVLQSFFQIYPQPPLSCAGYFRNPPSSAAVYHFSLCFSFCCSIFTSFCHISLSLYFFPHSSSVPKPSELTRCLLRQVIMESHKWTYYLRSTSTHHINSTYHGKLDSQFISIEFSISLSLSVQSDSQESIKNHSFICQFLF